MQSFAPGARAVISLMLTGLKDGGQTPASAEQRTTLEKGVMRPGEGVSCPQCSLVEESDSLLAGFAG